MKPDLREALRRGVLVGDGAMGTYLYQMGFPVGISYEELNLLKPDVIRDVHRRYYEAGARLIETNTFSANREKLSKFGLEGEVEAINRAGVKLARQAVGDDAYVVGAVGSIRAGKRKNVRTAKVKEDLRQQIEVLVDAGVDGLLLETFFDLEEMMLALKLIRKVSSLPVICQFTTEGVGATMDGVPMPELSRSCSRLAQTSSASTAAAARTVSCAPSNRRAAWTRSRRSRCSRTRDWPITWTAGIRSPQRRPISASPPVNSPISAHALSAVAAARRRSISPPSPPLWKLHAERERGGDTGDKRRSGVFATSEWQKVRGIAITEPPPAEPTIVDLVKERPTVIVELDPPRDLDIAKFMQGAAALKEVGVDALTMADNSLAVTRMSNLALGSIVQERVGIRPLIHIACRDRNMIGTQSHMMGLHALGIDHVLAVTGDPAKFGDLPGSSSVYDLTSFEIIRMIKQLNEGVAFSGKPLKKKANFIVGAAFNPNVKYLDKAVQRLERKIEAGADYIMTQPVYNAELIESIYQATRHVNIPIFLGIMPLASGGNAEYLHNEVPGIQLSDDVRRRMNGLKGEEGRAMGVQIAKELLDVAISRFNGIYLMTPFMAYEMTVELTQYVWEKAGRRDFHLSPLAK